MNARTEGLSQWASDHISGTVLYTRRKPFNALALLLLLVGAIVYFQHPSNPFPYPTRQETPTIPIQDSQEVKELLKQVKEVLQQAKDAPAAPAAPAAPVEDANNFHYPLRAGDAPLLPNRAAPGTVISSPGRELDVLDAFANFNRIPETCSFSSLELHDPFAPLCPDKSSFLMAASGGGRAGVDEPYAPRDCDMRWFHLDEICKIMSRYSAIYVIGDSMMRNTAVALITYLRADLYEGPRAQWNPEPPEEMNCHCKGPFETASCMWYVALSTSSVWENINEGEPHAIKCPKDNMATLEYIPETAYPLEDAIKGITDRLPKEKPSKPQAFILGHGVWNSLNETASGLWLDEVETIINTTNPWLVGEKAIYPRLFITPNAAGDNKPVQYQETQGNIALHRFENNMGPYLRTRGVDHLGMYNATIQNTTPDGTHAGMRSNLLKAMFIFNWLNFIDTSKYNKD